ncbi:trypsin-like peptidase domain-containing protein [Sphingomonas sp. Leaf25]|uniref:trypsin-like peptidase domain-containing protein n=1 Tax=Sphingomonas sp. Leaf25 TaxID=1735692 RepID=UPI001F39BABB|nr:trypsin-like peptidase domain-containing protein [Sphingomonas sp. Leaf25]
MTMVRWLLAWALMLGLGAVLAPAARADDVSAAARGVVRVLAIATVDGEMVDIEHGTGFAVAPNRIVTNAHVVELLERYPGEAVLAIVPSEGERSYEGRLLRVDTARDLALIEVREVRLPPLTLYTGALGEGDASIALGYPGNVDLATARSADDFVTPTAPVRSQGVLSGNRRLEGTAVLVHTASIARGNSGGPLLDRCGRVLGVNSALTRGEEGDASFAFAIADNELVAFLRDAGQPVATIATPCVTLADADARDRADAERQSVEDRERARAAAERAREDRLAALDTARADNAETRENMIALAALLLALSVLAAGGAGLLASRGDTRRARWAAGGGAVLLAGAIIVFVLRPDFDPASVKGGDAATAATRATPLAGVLQCTLMPERSRIIVSPVETVRFDWRSDGCMNRRTQYAEAPGGGWERILVPGEDATVSVLRFDPVSGSYTNSRYLLSAEAMERARTLRGQVQQKACESGTGARAALATQQSAIRTALPAQANERLVYRCTRAG